MLATAAVVLFTAWVAVGVPFGFAFAFVGVNVVDPVARDAKVGFRLLIVPGAAAFWPLLAWRWARGISAPTERTAHRDAARSRP